MSKERERRKAERMGENLGVVGSRRLGLPAKGYVPLLTSKESKRAKVKG